MKIHIKAIYIVSKKHKLNFKIKTNTYVSDYKEIKFKFGNNFIFAIIFESKDICYFSTVVSIANIATKKIKSKKEILEGYKVIL